MCGIVGIVSNQSLSDDHVLLLDRAIESIQHRGPDAFGVFTEGCVGLGHVRLSILDLTDAGRQPMCSGCGRYVITYNGEVYNYKEIAQHLKLDFLKSHSDTEVIVEAFAKIGESLFPMLNGMFAFALFDRYEKKLWLVRDRLGIKPLYVAKFAGQLLFGSEIKAIHAFMQSVVKIETNALAEWCYYGTTLGEQTLCSGIERLLPGHFIRLDISNNEEFQGVYWSPQSQSRIVEGDLVQRTRDLLESAVKRQLVSDVPVGVFLSGGIDSTAITAFASRHYQGTLATYSAGFDYDKGVNELKMAAKLAKQFGTEHHEIQISGMDVAETVERLIIHHDQPFSDAANIPLYLLSMRVKDRTKVVLQGDGGDELFGGYKRYATLSNLTLMKAGAALGRLANFFCPRNASYYNRQRYIDALLAKPLPKLMALLLTVEDEKQDPTQIFEAHIRQHFVDPFRRYREVASRFELRKPADQMLLIDSMIILPDVFLEKVDRSTMAASVEVRVPFLDNDLVEFCHQLNEQQKIPRGQQKYLLKQSLSGVVPNEVLYGKKTGFGVPFGYWLKGPLKELFFDQFSMFVSKHPNVINRAFVLEKYNDHLTGKRDSSFLLWKLLNLLIWSNHNNVDWEATN